jgi:hypothetical protein
MVECVEILKMLGDGVKRPTDVEMKNKLLRVVVSSIENIKQGDIFYKWVLKARHGISALG